MNLAEIRAAVERRSGIAYDADALNEVINEALVTISTERDWPWLDATWTFTETADRDTYTPPWSWRKVRSVTRAGRLLPMVPVTQLDGDTSEIGWTVEGDRLLLSPVASTGGGEVVVRIVREEQELIADSSTPLLPAEWHVALVNLAASIVLERLERWQAADRCKARYDDTRERMIATARRTAGPHRVRVRPGSMV